MSPTRTGRVGIWDMICPPVSWLIVNSFAACEVPPMPTDEASFGPAAFQHLRPVKLPTCWISLFVSLRPALYRALRSSFNPRVAVINLDYLINNPIGSHPRVLRAGLVARRFEIMGYDWEQGQEYPYSYQYEYIAWGIIENEAIVADFSICESHISFLPR